MTWISDRALERLRGDPGDPQVPESRYAIADVIGRGGMSTVYRAHDRVLDRDVALKVLDEPLADRALAARLASEARVLARLEHPSIVPVHDMGELPDGRPYYVMTMVRGRDLAAAVAAEPSLHGRLRLFERIGDAVAFAHARGIIHRDLKPSNIMVGAFGEVLVLDWGLAKWQRQTDGDASGGPHQPPAAAASSSMATETPHASLPAQPADPLTRTGAVLGTPGYMAPEQLAGEPVDERTDVYALGVLLAWLLGASEDGGRETVRRGRGATVPGALAAIAERARAARPADRYASVADLVADVRRYLDGLAVSVHREGALGRAARFARRHRVAVALVAAYLVMRIVLLLWARV